MCASQGRKPPGTPRQPAVNGRRTTRSRSPAHQLPLMAGVEARRVRRVQTATPAKPRNTGRRRMPNVTPLRPGDPRRVGRYRLTGRVDDFAGEGQDVFLAQRVDGETVLAAFPRPGRAGDAAARDRFVAEARVARNIPPFCVARILDTGVEGDRPYLVTEFGPGPSLAELAAAEGPMPGAVLRVVAIGTATGIASIHQAGLVHGQVGPDTVVLGRDGPRVVHFSTTPPYGPAPPAADILAWAEVVTFAATGHRRPSAAARPALPPRVP